MGGGKRHVGDIKAGHHVGDIKVGHHVGDIKTGVHGVVKTVASADTGTKDEAAVASGIAEPVMVVDAELDRKVKTDTTTTGLVKEVSASLNVPATFVVGEYNLGYKGTGLVLLVLYSMGLCVVGVACWRVAQLLPGEFFASLLWALFCGTAMMCVESVAASSVYARLIYSPSQPAICAAIVTVTFAFYLGMLYPYVTTWMCVCICVSIVTILVVTSDLWGLHLRHLKLDELEAEYAQHVSDLCSRAASAWNLQGIVYVDRLPPRSADLDCLRRAHSKDTPLFLLPTPLTNTIALQLTRPSATAITHPFRLFMNADSCTITCSITFLEPGAQGPLIAMLQGAYECRAKLALETITLCNAQPSQYVMSAFLTSALQVAANITIPTSNSDERGEPTNSERRPHRHLTVAANTAETKSTVTVNDGVLQVGVHIGSLTDKANIRQILREYVAYRT
jgi:hypothetical protein